MAVRITHKGPRKPAGKVSAKDAAWLSKARGDVAKVAKQTEKVKARSARRSPPKGSQRQMELARVRRGKTSSMGGRKSKGRRVTPLPDNAPPITVIGIPFPPIAPDPADYVPQAVTGPPVQMSTDMSGYQMPDPRVMGAAQPLSLEQLRAQVLRERQRAATQPAPMPAQAPASLTPPPLMLPPSLLR
jgi:hypothetical protein